MSLCKNIELSLLVRARDAAQRKSLSGPRHRRFDTGLLVSVLQGAIAESGVSMLTDGDGLAMLRDASIGRIWERSGGQP